ncbi:MAG: hypothetical protein GXO06_00755 [Epsilonproteobacteria bacterium]|nr:hypothetical protein [Campylobacterota bacterium]
MGDDDKWMELLNMALKELEACQEERGFSSCYSCEKLLDCKVRERYINSVYTSMNRGEDGGFEF